MKAYTDINQSKKLAEILPLESADMYWYLATKGNPKAMFNEEYNEYGDFELPCWSLSALLEIIPKHIKEYNVLQIDIAENAFSIWYAEIGFGVNRDLPDITKKSAIDACVDMILKLKKKNLI